MNDLRGWVLQGVMTTRIYCTTGCSGRPKPENVRPFESTAAATFSFTPVAEGTKVTWAMDGDTNFFGKAIHLVLPMEKIVGGDFEQGLGALKGVAERAPAGEVANAR